MSQKLVKPRMYYIHTVKHSEFLVKIFSEKCSSNIFIEIYGFH